MSASSRRGRGAAEEEEEDDDDDDNDNGERERGAYMDGNLGFTTGESGDETDMSVCGEKGDLIEPVEERRGASRAMTGCTKPRLRMQEQWQ